MKWSVSFFYSLFVVANVLAQDAVVEPEVEWQKGPVKGVLSAVSTLDVPEGCVFTGAEGTRVMMERMGNLVSDAEIGMVSSISNGWFAVFEFDSVGYVKDDDKDSLDADSLMKTMLKNQVESNSQRRAAQLPELEIVGWYKVPFYNEKTKNLEWCTKLKTVGEEGEFANHNIRILGRYGITRVTLVADLDELDSAIPELASILNGYEYNHGGRYAEYRKGDKVAQYGLATLVAGGAAAVAVKSGLLKHIWKFLVIGAASVGGFFKKLFKRK